MRFHYESEPERSEPVEVARDVVRMVASNPSPMTYHGTNTYILRTSQGTFVLDPGPQEDDRHFERLVATVGTSLAGIIVSHHHNDHFGLTSRLAGVTGAPVYAFERFADDTFWPDVLLKDGDTIADYEVLHTPGHASDHLCLAREDGVVFTADHVMTWNSSIILLPDGDMADYFAQLQRLIDRDDSLYLPGHGPPLADPSDYVRALLSNRQRREHRILEAVRSGMGGPADLSARLYRKVDEHIAWAAQRNVEAHLEKLHREGLVRRDGEVWIAAA